MSESEHGQRQDVTRQLLDQQDLRIGEVRRSSKLGTEAWYRLRAITGDHVEVEVIDAPGLSQGFRLRLTREAFEAMTLTE
jgi:hypothetical protein